MCANLFYFGGPSAPLIMICFFFRDDKEGGGRGQKLSLLVGKASLLHVASL